MKRIKRIVAVTGTYKDQSGADKKRYTNIGSLFERPDGSMCFKLESVPVGWDGWANMYEMDEQKKPADGGSSPATRDDLDSDVPF